MAENKNKTTGSNQESNQNWDDQNDQPRSGNQEPNPERFKKSGGSAFNEDETATGYGSNQRKQQGNVGPLDADMDELPSENLDRKDLGTNKTGPGLG
jgi:hypothetical protein